MNLISALLDLLFDNVFFLVILFGIISFVMNKIRGAQPTGQKPPRNAMPPFGGDVMPGPGTRRPPAAQRSQGRMYESAPAPQPQTDAEPYLAMEMDPRLQREAAQAPPSRPVRREARQPAPAAKPRSERSVLLNARHAAQGMMWSEVFGPPRALKQHRTRRR